MSLSPQIIIYEQFIVKWGRLRLTMELINQCLILKDSSNRLIRTLQLLVSLTQLRIQIALCSKQILYCKIIWAYLSCKITMEYLAPAITMLHVEEIRLLFHVLALEAKYSKMEAISTIKIRVQFHVQVLNILHSPQYLVKELLVVDRGWYQGKIRVEVEAVAVSQITTLLLIYLIKDSLFL